MSYLVSRQSEGAQWDLAKKGPTSENPSYHGRAPLFLEELLLLGRGRSGLLHGLGPRGIRSRGRLWR